MTDTPAVAKLERIAVFLRQERRLALDAGDVQTYRTIKASLACVQRLQKELRDSQPKPLTPAGNGRGAVHRVFVGNSHIDVRVPDVEALELDLRIDSEALEEEFSLID